MKQFFEEVLYKVNICYTYVYTYALHTYVLYLTNFYLNSLFQWDSFIILPVYFGRVAVDIQVVRSNVLFVHETIRIVRLCYLSVIFPLSEFYTLSRLRKMSINL